MIQAIKTIITPCKTRMQTTDNCCNKYSEKGSWIKLWLPKHHLLHQQLQPNTLGYLRQLQHQKMQPNTLLCKEKSMNEFNIGIVSGRIGLSLG